MSQLAIWAGILFCISQSAMFSGANLAFFSIPKLNLEIEAKRDKKAKRMLGLRKDSNFLLTTILWGNVGVNVLLALLTDSVLTGIIGFAFSTFLITIFGEIVPQAYFSRNAMQVAYYLGPIIRFYQYILYIVAKPTALILDVLVGDESKHYFEERTLQELISKHVESDEAEEIDKVEGIGAINFLKLDDTSIKKQGAPINKRSIISYKFPKKGFYFPAYSNYKNNPLIKKIQASGEKWVILTDETGKPRYVLDADGFLRTALFRKTKVQPKAFTHKPIIEYDPKKTLGDVVQQLTYTPEHPSDYDIDNDVILYWGEEEKRIITGSDILGLLLKGIAKKKE